MSNVSTSHNVVPFVSGKSEALTGQRLTVAKYKSTAKTPAKFPNVCASIPLLEISEELFLEHPALLSHVTEWLREKQDDVFKSVYESHGGTLTSINDAEIDLPSIIGYLNAASVSGRLTKESIEQWYASDCAPVVYVYAAVSKYSYVGADVDDIVLSEAQELKVQQTVNAYKDLFSGLAGGATKYAPNIRKFLSDMLSNCPETALVERLQNRLDAMETATSLEDTL